TRNMPSFPTRRSSDLQLGKVILFQNDNARMGEVATLLNQVNSTGNAFGYSLLDDYGDVFDPTNAFHSESILEIPHSSLAAWGDRSEEHTSELQSRENL